MFGIWDVEANRVLSVDEIKKLNLLIDCEGNTIQLYQEPMAIVVESGIINFNHKPILYRKIDISCRYKPLWKVGSG